MTTTPAQIAAANDWVDTAYRYMEKGKDFVAREAQVELSKAVAKSFLSGDPLAAEAPTGTGKTLAYLIGALAASEASGASSTTPIVVSTATKALQQQLLTEDLPRLSAIGLINLANVAIAKGKGNYLCLKHAEDSLSLLQRAAMDPELFLDSGTETMDETDVQPLVDAYLAGHWDGDFDSYEGRRPKSVRTIAVSGDTCMRKKCEHYKDCAFYKQRHKLSTAKIIVVNHDLLLLDLWLSATSDVPTLPAANYWVVFDEAHHLPEKAIKVGSYEAQLSYLLQALPKLGGIQKLLRSSPDLQKVLAPSGVKSELFERGPVATSLRDLITMLRDLEVDADSSVRRFPRGKLPAPVEAAVKELEKHLSPLHQGLDLLCSAIRDAAIPQGPLAERAGELLRRALDVKQPANEALECFNGIILAKRNATWLYRKDDTVSLNTAPLEGADVLNKLLWTNPRVIASAMVSATLRDMGGYDRFKRRAGLPESTQFMTLPYSFPYKESKLVVPGMKATPKPAERRMFLPELATKLPEAIDPTEGTLVLFPSWTMLKEFAPKLKAKFGAAKVKMQGEQVVKMLVRDHRSAINRGEGSVLLGVATLAEGLDLPGKYCTHVIIIALPFAVPTDPVEQELSEILGNRYFGERSLPDAMVRLTQMVGRLLRRESDRGRVTVFDRRLASTSYGRQMLENLPPFEKVIEPVEA